MRLMRDLVGDVLSGRYQMVARIAGGGMGDVYRAQDLLLDRAVAVKVLQPALASDPELVARFKLEARAAARLAHPNVVAVFDWGAADDRTYYMVMEYVAGTDLRDVLVSRGWLEPAHAVEIAIAVCDALKAAHQEGLVHRDIKPENVLIARTGRVKVADFGIAAVADADRTMPGVIPGTLRYLSPEQAAGLRATHVSDVWAAGAVLSECLTGRPPQQGAGADLMRRRAEEPPVAPSTLAPLTPVELDEIVLKACAVDPGSRWQDASYMADELRRFAVRSLPEAEPLTALLEEITVDIQIPDAESTEWLDSRQRRRRAHPHPSKRRRRGLAAVAALVGAVLIAGAVQAVSALRAPDRVRVPLITDLDQRRATARLESLGLEVKVESSRSKAEPAGEVLAQSPQTGTLEEGRTVTLTVSSGPPLRKLPSLVGLAVAAAEEKLTSRGFIRGEITKKYSMDRIGTVIAQRPLKERIRWGSEVDLVVSRGPEPLDVPNVAELTGDKATARLKSAGFTATLVESYDNKVPPGRVIGTSPGTGEIALQGSEIQVYVSIGPEFEKLVMPDVTGKSAGPARRQLEDMGLRVKVVESCPGGSVVAETEPLAGSTVYENDRVALFVC
ncbi:MAG: Stk1 family PASTA domain-containing Ser/Thr kinase [Actinomycetota bacterium]